MLMAAKPTFQIQEDKAQNLVVPVVSLLHMHRDMTVSEHRGSKIIK